MNGPTGDMTYADETPSRREVTLTLGAARRMLPLVRRIVQDVLEIRQQLARLQPEQDSLDRRRHSLGWSERARRYQVREEISSLDKNLQDSSAELEGLGLTLLDPEQGRLGFPTLVNDRRAFFSWRPGEEDFRYWHYLGENAQRPIPAAWRETSSEVRLAGRR